MVEESQLGESGSLRSREVLLHWIDLPLTISLVANYDSRR